MIGKMAGEGLEECLVSLSQMGDEELRHDCLHLAVVMRELSKGRYGEEVVRRIDAGIGPY